MPEGPEVETIRCTLENRLRNLRISSIWRSKLPLRTPTTQRSFDFLLNDHISNLSRFAKILIIETDKERGLFVRFGMSGRMFFEPLASERPKHTHLAIQFDKSEHELRFIDARRFGDVAPYRNAKERESFLEGLGPDCLVMTAGQIAEVAKKIKQSDREIKVILLDQNIVSGIGNIYASEALFLSRIHPSKRSSSLPLTAIRSALTASQEVMLKAVANKGTTFMSYLDGNGEKGGNQNHLLVFGRESQPCPICRAPIKRLVQAGRSTFYCSVCQRQSDFRRIDVAPFSFTF